MAIPDRARAVPYGDVWETYKALEAFVDSTDFIAAGAGFLVTQSEDGAVVTYQDDTPWLHPFEVSASSSAVSVSAGLMADEVPRVHLPAAGVYRRIDGLDDDGRFLGYPRLSIDRPTESPVTFVCLRCLIDRSTGSLATGTDGEILPEALQIVHRHEKPRRTADGGSETDVDSAGYAVGYDVIGRLYWTANLRGIRQIGQVINWHRNFAFRKGEGESVPDRFFPFHR